MEYSRQNARCVLTTEHLLSAENLDEFKWSTVIIEIKRKKTATQFE